MICNSNIQMIRVEIVITATNISWLSNKSPPHGASYLLSLDYQWVLENYVMKKTNDGHMENII